MATISSLRIMLVVQVLVAASAELILLPPGEIRRNEGRNVFITCRYRSGVERGEFTWYGPSVSPADDNRVTITTTSLSSELTIFGLRQKDNGTYHCTYASEHTHTTIIVYVNPSFGNVSRQQNVTMHSTSLIVCPVHLGYPEASIVWSKDGNSISNPRFKVIREGLEITAVQLQDAGSYSCSLERPGWGAISVVITVQVLDHLSIVSPPEPRVTAVVDGAQYNTTFICTAVGFPTPCISWTHSTQNITQNGRFQVMVEEDGGNRISSTLAVNNLTATDSGIIWCVANNHLSDASANTTLSVLTSDFNVTITVADRVQFVVTLFEGYSIPQPVRLRIVFTSAEAARTGTRNMTSETYFNESTLIHEVPNSEVLYIRFKVQVALSVGSEVGPFVPNLDSAPVYQIPRILTPPEPAIVAVADDELKSTTFTCKATAVNVTALQISWIHNSQPLKQSQGRFEVMQERGASSVTSRLTLHNLTAEDNGIIQCVADNPTDMTSASSNTTLFVLTDDFQLGVVVTTEGNLILTVTIQSPLPGPLSLRIKYTWIIQHDSVERSTRMLENMGEIILEVSRSEVPFQRFKLQVALEVGGVVGPFVPDLENATVYTLPAAAQSSELTIAILVLVPFLILVICASIPAIILKRRRKKVETIQDYASTAIELLNRGSPLRLPPDLPPHLPPHRPQQSLQQYPPQLPLTHLEDLEHHRGSDNLPISTDQPTNKSAHSIPLQPSHPTIRTDTHLQPSHPTTGTDDPSQPLHPTTRTDTPSQPSHPATGTGTPSQPLCSSHDTVHDPLTADYTPTKTGREENSSKDVSKGASNQGPIAASTSHCQESSKLLPPVHTSGEVGRSEGVEATDSVLKKMHPFQDDYEQLGAVYNRIGTYETVGNPYDKIGTYETVGNVYDKIGTYEVEPAIPRTDAPTKEKPSSKDKALKKASNEGTYETVGNVYDKIGTYETIGNVYDKICTYETIGNVYDNSLVPKLGFHETSL